MLGCFRRRREEWPLGRNLQDVFGLRFVCTRSLLGIHSLERSPDGDGVRFGL